MPARKVSVESTMPKPSLASLKPDKTKGDAAKKRSVKRIAATASKKASPIRIKKITDNLKHATVTKKAETKVKKSTEREQIKTVSISATKSASKTIKRSAKRNAPVEQKRPAAVSAHKDPLIRMPQNMSIRAREKVLVILESVLDDFEHSAERISLVSGLCFVVLGSYLALSFSGLLPGVSQVAQLSGATAGTTSDMTVQELTPSQQPKFKALDQIPPELKDNAQYTFSLTNVSNVSVALYSLDTGNRISVNAEKLLEDTYRYTLEANRLPADTYVVKVNAESAFSHTKYSFELGHFKVAAPAVPVTETASTTAVLPEVTSDGAIAAEDSEASSTAPVAPPVSASKLKLEVASVIKEQTVLTLHAPDETKFIELYARPVKSINSRYLGLAEKQYDGWYYFFNTLNIPNGDYELYGRTRLGDVFVQSNSVNTQVNNVSAVPNSPVAAEPAAVDASSSDAVIDTVARPVRTFSEASFESASSSNESDTAVVTEADAIFSQYHELLSDLLRRYAVALQSGDKVMLRTIESEITSVKEGILDQVLSDEAKNELADNISQEFDGRLDSLKKRIGTFEQLRHSAGAEDVGVDSDGDGISDFDENNLYRTDAHAVDSDSDGFTDGIEIMRGYDPRDPAGQTAIAFELPQDTVGLEESDTIKIDAVYPSIKQDESETIVQSEIHGKALPNSFVTLYIFSSPNIVTVRTGDDGAFVYTFEKELEDGEHEVYAAVTDNSGAIVAHSTSFKFVKQADSYTPVAVATNHNLIGAVNFKEFELYKTVIGLGVLALGIILLMLGANLKTTRKETVPLDGTTAVV